MRNYSFARLTGCGAGVVAVTVALVMSFGGVASAAAVKPDPTANGKTTAQFKAACAGRDGTYSDGTGKDLETGREYHKLTCNSSKGIHSCEHAFVTRDCTFQPSRPDTGTGEKILNGPTRVSGAR
jgi:hypothetical protein